MNDWLNLVFSSRDTTLNLDFVSGGHDFNLGFASGGRDKSFEIWFQNRFLNWFCIWMAKLNFYLFIYF